MTPPVLVDNEELARMYAGDQSDRTSGLTTQAGISAAMARDAARLARVKELYPTQAMQTGADFYHAAMILQHAHEPEDYLLAHELCIIAVSKGAQQAKWLAAASEDRYLMSIGRPQRFGTQYRRDGLSGSWYLYEVDPRVNDETRLAFDVPPLSEAQARAVKMNTESAPSAA